MHILVTGAAGFIGFHLTQRLLQQGHSVVGLDNLNDYYSVQLKKDRLALLTPLPRFRFVTLDMADGAALEELFAEQGFSHIAHLAAQAGVRYSLENPQSYIQSNLVAFGNLLECCRHHQVRHLLFASSSSVYGLNAKLPYCVRDTVDHPVSLYAASKRANELMAHAYSQLYALPCTGLRFFTVYGPWGRPDMAPHLFAQAIFAGKPIKVFNQGKMLRDFTYIADIVEGVARILPLAAEADPNWNPAAPAAASSSAPWRIYNIGNNRAVELMDFIALLEKHIGRAAIKEFLPMQPGDVRATYADIDDFSAKTAFAPSTPLDQGLAHFVAWYREYYGHQASD